MTEIPYKQAAPRRRRKADVILIKDLAPRKDVRGGRAKRLFGERHDPAEEEGPESRGPVPTTDP